VTIVLKGTKDLKMKLNAGNIRVAQAVTSATLDIVNEVAQKSLSYVPFDTGDLSASQHITLPKWSGQQCIAKVSYGGTAAPYALIQHENKKFFHPAKDNGGTGPVGAPEGRGYKYLEYPAKQAAKKYPKDIVKAANQKLRAL
jgi:hypothetical protein